MTAADLRAKRAAAGIPGHAICQVAGISRAKLSDVERGYVAVSIEELRRIDCAIDQIVRTKRHLTTLATEAGLTLTEIRL
jgi:transcriptional regulator with XRE-family HTH domain